MDELVKRISEKLGITHEHSRKAIIITADFLRTKIPASIYKEIELVLDLENITEEEMKEIGLFKLP